MLIAQNITKKFGGVTALNKVNMELHPGMVNAIIGENGAGKSTLMKVLSGVYVDYEGAIVYNNEPLKLAGTKDAEAKGIVIIHQELNLVPGLSITENIFLGRERCNAMGILDKKEMARETRTLLEKVKLDAEPGQLVGSLKVGQQQLVEIAKALHTKANVIIMDEPTSAISDKEVDNLFVIINELRSEGKTIVYISHKLKELFTIADRFVVMRDGCSIESGLMADMTQDDLIRKMTGRAVSGTANHTTQTFTEPALRVENISLKGASRVKANVLTDISFTLHKGEIVGLYGLMGAGRTELMETLFGLHPKRASGNIFVNEKAVQIQSPIQAINQGIALVPEDRKAHGLILDQKIKTNISITVLNQLEKWGIVLRNKKETELSKEYIQQLGIKTHSENNVAGNLSGGNQQKIVLAKWLATHPGILLLDEPTRGIDINARFEIYNLMKKLAASGMAILLVSSELPEILTASHRVLVMAEGRLTANIPIAEATESYILKHAIQHNITA
ncbi:D-xylose ABC transporter ATP-binding protein [Niastella yeongjuensis]|uniref:D-xylose ABC transporter ATP-binding protein n=1 Tax=Niastella yeongjuensis TaxID=354355 RepID=A0A1V9FCC4_9BACT|nr:sugar ABC transporter ATP-binding protein [Niastella yeongjuensis]OQP56043.1 D-xylose ABC transporter ATP-binding protein [Niastella yeongjuensis]SEP24472.1 ribose transport system ATP-binding protein [Niastella yeongjuensis]